MNFSRVTLPMIDRLSLQSLQSIQQRRERLTGQLSSGLRVQDPSDDPVAAAEIIQTNSQLSTGAQALTNLQRAGDQLQTVDSALNQAILLVQRAQTLAAEGANFTQTAATRSSIAAEVSGLIQGLLAVANTSFGGRYVFAGSADGAQPFVADSTSSGILYRGDAVQRSIAFAGGAEGQVSIDGQSIFLSPSSFIGSGRSPGIIGATAPTPPAGLGITFSNGVNGAISGDIPGFFVAPAAPAASSPGDQVTVNFQSADGSLQSSITAILAGAETAGQIASALNIQIASNAVLAGKFTFSDEGGKLKIIESDTVGQGFSFTASATGSATSGLEGGGTIGGQSAQEIAAALNAQIALNPELSAAHISFAASNGEVQITSDTGLTFTALDFDRGTGFLSGLAGTHTIGGAQSSNVFAVLQALQAALSSNDSGAIEAALSGLQAAVTHLSNVQGFYGAAENQIQASVDALQRASVVNQQQLSRLQDADSVQAASELARAQTSEEAALQVEANQLRLPNLFSFLA